MIGYIYFIIYRKEIIYIGQTSNIIERVRTYLTYAYFDDIRLIKCDLDKVKHYEKRLIKYFKPKCNTHNNPNKTPEAHTLMPKRTERKRKRIWEFKAMWEPIEEVRTRKKIAA